MAFLAEEQGPLMDPDPDEPPNRDQGSGSDAGEGPTDREPSGTRDRQRRGPEDPSTGDGPEDQHPANRREEPGAASGPPDGPDPTDGRGPGPDGDRRTGDEDRPAVDADDEPRTVAGVDLTRRRLLAGGGLVLGTLGLGIASIWNAPRTPAPEVPADRLESDGWERTETDKSVVSRQHYGPLTITAYGHTVRWADSGTRRAVRDRTAVLSVGDTSREFELGDVAPDAVQQPFGQFSASRVDFGPDVDNAPLGIGRAEVMASVRQSARQSFVASLRESGMRDVDRIGTGRLTLATGERAPLYEYRATLPIEGATLTSGSMTLQIPAKTLDVDGYLAVWHSGDFAMIAGGGHPAQDYRQELTRDTAFGTATLSLSLGLEPDRYREEILGYMRDVR